MVASSTRQMIHFREINGQRREIRQTMTARIYSRPRFLAALDRLLMDPPEQDSADDIRDLNERIGRC
jgi:hypothetical protein